MHARGGHRPTRKRVRPLRLQSQRQRGLVLTAQFVESGRMPVRHALVQRHPLESTVDAELRSGALDPVDRLGARRYRKRRFIVVPLLAQAGQPARQRCIQVAGGSAGIALAGAAPLQQHHLVPGLGEPPRGDRTGDPGAHHHHIGLHLFRQRPRGAARCINPYAACHHLFSRMHPRRGFTADPCTRPV